MILTKPFRHSGRIGSKKVEVINNTETTMTVRVDGEIHIIQITGKSPKQIGQEIREL